MCRSSRIVRPDVYQPLPCHCRRPCQCLFYLCLSIQPPVLVTTSVRQIRNHANSAYRSQRQQFFAPFSDHCAYRLALSVYVANVPNTANRTTSRNLLPTNLISFRCPFQLTLTVIFVPTLVVIIGT